MYWRVVGLLAAAGVTLGLSAGVVIPLGRSLAGCYIDAVPLPLDHLCGGLWGAEWVPVGLLALSTALLLASVSVAVKVLFRQFGGAAHLRRKLERHLLAPPPRLADIAASAGVAPVHCVDLSAPLAVTVGLLRPRVLVTRGLVQLLDEDELRAVLLHEQVHVEGRHPALYGLARAAAGAGFVLPALGPLARRAVLHAEVLADEAAVRETGRAPLVRALDKITGVPAEADLAAIGSIQGMLDQRMLALAGRELEAPASRSSGIATLAAAALLVMPALAVIWSYLVVRGVL